MFNMNQIMQNMLPVFHQRERFDQASELYLQGQLTEVKRVLGVPVNAYECNLLANVALEEKRYELAEKYSREAIATCYKDKSDFHYCLGMSLYYQGKHLLEAEDELIKALFLNPNSHLYRLGLSKVLQATERYQEGINLAVEVLEKIAQSNPEYIDLGDYYFMLFLAGKYQKYWKQVEESDPLFNQLYKDAKNKGSLNETGEFIESVIDSTSLWQGEPLAGKNILLYRGCFDGHSGLGDSIMFFRFIPGIASWGCNITLAAEESLRKLAAQLSVDIHIWTKESTDLKFDYRLPLYLMPARLGVTINSIPTAPYLIAEPALVACWKERLAKFQGLKVGLCWRSKEDPKRTIEPKQLARLLSVPGISFFSLQVHEGVNRRFVQPGATL